MYPKMNLLISHKIVAYRVNALHQIPNTWYKFKSQRGTYSILKIVEFLNFDTSNE